MQTNAIIHRNTQRTAQTITQGETSMTSTETPPTNKETQTTIKTSHAKQNI